MFAVIGFFFLIGAFAILAMPLLIISAVVKSHNAKAKEKLSRRQNIKDMREAMMPPCEKHSVVLSAPITTRYRMYGSQ